MKKHAYLIIAHEDAYQLGQLLSLLNDERNDIYLQIDSKGGLCLDDIVLDKSSLIVLPPFPIYWGGFSQIQAELNLLKAASANRYQYYHLLTGSDLPLVNQDRIHMSLENSTSEYVSFPRQNQAFARFKATQYHLLVENRLYEKYWAFRMIGHSLVKLQSAIGIDRSRRTGEIYYHGSAYFSITHSLVECVLAHEQWVRRMFHHTLACDEVFLQTLLMKSPCRCGIAVPDSNGIGNLRYIDRRRGRKNHPYTFRMSDYEELKRASKHCLFARKFSRTIDHVIVDTIVNKIKNEGAL